MALALAGFAFLGGLALLALFGREMRRRFNALFAQTLILYGLLVLDHPLFLFALELCYLFRRKRLVPE